MARDDRDILDVLRFELSFLEDGGYGRSPHTPWRPPSIFEDSPICPNFCDPARPQPCESCLLIDFVPEAQRQESVPCRFIPISEEGRTVEDFYRTGTQIELEEALGKWLRAEIKKIEQERAVLQKEGVA
jgi:hypothetical protein